jgi:hypothetical protein
MRAGSHRQQTAALIPVHDLELKDEGIEMKKMKALR